MDGNRFFYTAELTQSFRNTGFCVCCLYLFGLHKLSETVLHCGWKSTFVDCESEFLAPAFPPKLNGSIINPFS